LSAGAGAKGPRWYAWQWRPLAAPVPPQGCRWLLVRRRLRAPPELTAYVVFARHATALASVVQVAGSRWTMEQGFAEAKGEVGLDRYAVRSGTGWYRHIPLAMGAYALLPVLRAANLPPEEAPQKTRSQPPSSRLAAVKATRGLTCRCVCATFAASSGASYWPYSSAWNGFWPGPRGAAGIKVSPTIGTINDAQLHNYNCSTRTVFAGTLLCRVCPVSPRAPGMGIHDNAVPACLALGVGHDVRSGPAQGTQDTCGKKFPLTLL